MSVSVELSPAFFLADSHVQYIKAAVRHHLFAPSKVTGCEVGGATAIGMRNPNAMTNAPVQFRKSIEALDKKTIIIIQLGEVDCGYVVCYRSKKYSELVSEQMKQSVDAHIDFVDELIRNGFDKIILTSATLPTISDSDQDEEVVKKRSGINISQIERTKLTLTYNKKIRAAALKRNLQLVDVTPRFINKRTGLVDRKFRNKNPLDHHMNYGRAASVWAMCLLKALDFYDPQKQNKVTMIASHSSYIKALALHSQDLPSDMKITVNVGDHLNATYDATVGEFFVVRNIILNGNHIASTFRLIHKAHWKLLLED